MNNSDAGRVDRRDFFKAAGAGLTAAAAGVMLTPREQLMAQAQVEKDRLSRIASCSYPIRYIFKNRAGAGRSAPPPTTAPNAVASSPSRSQARAGDRKLAGTGEDRPPQAAAGTTPPSRANAGVSSQEMKQKYGEITMLDFPQFTKDTFPGVTHMDLFSGLFGDVTDDTMFAGRTFDPSSASGKKWLDKLVAKMAATGTKVQHISNNAPTNLASGDGALRKAGVEVGKKWLDAAAILGAKSVRMNSPQALGPSIRPQAVRDPTNGYPKNDEIMPLLVGAIESYKEMADYMLFHGLKALAPYAHTNVHAKYWDRWGTKNDVQRSTRIMLAAGFKGTFALEYEEGPLNGIEGAKYLYKEVLAALSSPAPVI
jgi:hypothetical protein